MGILRTYFDKDNTIVRNSCVNTGRNPITELFHGGSNNVNELKYSRYLLNIDLTEIINRVNNKELFTDNMSHKINLTNTSCFDQELFCKTVASSCGDVKRATAFDLILFKVPETWDEGNGYDYVENRPLNCDLGDQVFCEGPSNWFERTTNVDWLESGVYGGDPTMYTGGGGTGYTGTTIDLVIGAQHFDHGDENFCIDISSYINGLISSGITATTLGVAYDYAEEVAPQEETCYVGFFSRDTQTVYEPFMETIFDDTIKDDRDNFYLDKDNRLYLYVNAGGERVNATFSGVDIYDQNGNLFQSIPSSGISQTTTGVYYVTVNVSSNPTSGYCGNIQFMDTWKDVTINGNNLGDIELDFIIKEKEDYYNIGSVNSAGASGLGVGDAGNLSIYSYEFSLDGIKSKEKIKRGDTRRVNVTARIPFVFDQSQAVDKIYYRIYIKEGETQLDYIEWTEVDRTPDGNFFLIDTSWFIPNDYYLEVKIESGQEIRTYEKIFQFEIVSEKDWC
jgi:hypothetical protein